MKKVSQDCADSVTSATTAWHFNPPAAPHMGGIWEPMVRSVKEAMKTLDDGRTLSDEVLQTTLAEAEDMINPRPLTYIPQDSANDESITPNHFLRGSVSPADWVVQPVNSAEALRDTYKRSQDLANHMWERWLKEYLLTINQRSKWFEEQNPLTVDDLVFIVEGKNRKSWTRGIVQELLPGSDGRVRQALVRTTTKVYRRAVSSLAVIEVK
ncbi:uncharacterized protein LOC129720517 [Wyeomyia smithii]|uniref:uncharacterized protein LOC129720517 n=1 Tax=Wyeomyia smithii TaxID=174621 RepID=UPI002467EA1A|nr:uncharacterized protein LOC129720517 [Wyeomyia smithii]